jgi:predicted transcriptional regulator
MIQPGQVAAIRKRLGISQAELAKKSGVSQSFIAKIEGGRVDPAFSKAQAISDTLEEIRSANHKAAVNHNRAVEVMNPDVFVLCPGDIAEVAASSMTKRMISQIPVMNGETVEGTVTDASLMEFVMKTHDTPGALKTPISRLMDDPLPQVRPETSEEELLTLLKTFPAVLVRDKLKILGIITKFDILSKRVEKELPKGKKESQAA